MIAKTHITLLLLQLEDNINLDLSAFKTSFKLSVLFLTTEINRLRKSDFYFL